MRKELKIGLIAMGFSMTLNCLLALPEFAMGFLFAIALFFESIGILPQAAYDKLKAVKRRLFHRA